MPTRRFLSRAIVMFCAVLVASCTAGLAQEHALDCKPKDQLLLYLQHNHRTPGVVLAFDHLTRAWTGYHWDGAQDLRRLEEDLEIKTPFTNKPRVFLAKENIDRLEVFVVNTNPLLFATRDVDNTVANIEELANLQKLTSLLGGFLASAVGGLAPDFVAPLAPAAGVAGVEGEAEGILEAMSIDLDRAARATEGRPKSLDRDRLLALYEVADSIVAGLRTPTSNVQSALASLAPSQSRLDRDIQRMQEAAVEIRSYVQLVESGRPDGIEPREFNSLPNFPDSLNNGLRDLAVSRSALAGVRTVCPGILTVLRDAIRLYRIPLPQAQADRRVILDQFQDRVEELGKLDSCELRGPIASVRDHLARTGPTAGGVGPAEDEILRPLFRSLDLYLSRVDAQQQALKAAAELLAKGGDGAKVAGAVQDFIERRQRHLLDPKDTCSLRAGVLRVERVQGLGRTLGLTSFGTDGFQIISNSPFKDSVSFRHAEPSGSFEIQRAWKWDFDVDVATYYSEVVDPVFKAGDLDGEGEQGKVITLADEDTRAGELAMFLGLQWRSRKASRSLISIGPQIGVGLSTDHPAIFGGLGIGLGRYIKLGVGWTWQEVKELRSGQRVGVTPVADDASIKIRDGYEDDYYVSLSITLDNLPFFNAP